MLRIMIFVLSILILSCLTTVKLSAKIILPGENNSLSLAEELSMELRNNPSGDLTPFYIEKLIELEPAAGKAKIVKAFHDGIRKLMEEGNGGNHTAQILRLAVDELEGNSAEIVKNFSILNKWNISGPWKRYGKPDIDYEFFPEKMYKIENVEKGMNITTDESGFLHPYEYKHEPDEIYYASCSFQAQGGIILWIVSDAEYRIIVNGREISGNRQGGKKIIKAFLLQGSKGYTLQVKMQCGSENTYPYLRGMITDESHKPVKLTGSTTVFNYNFTAVKIFSSDENGQSVPQDASVLTHRMSNLIQNGDYTGGYKLGLLITERYPLYYPVYEKFIPMLDIMNRDAEFNAAVEKFSKTFPDSAMPQIWLADFYMTRDKTKFSELMKSADISKVHLNTAESYILYLCGHGKYSEALSLCSVMKISPQFGSLASEIIKASGDNNLLRRFLLERAAERNETEIYYQLGLAEMHLGFDPVMYWRKGYSLDNDPSLMHDLSDIYENSILGPNDFYTGIYTDMHPEFAWYGKKRKMTVHIFESGRVVIEGEDIVPSGRKLKSKKFYPAETEIISGEIKTSIPYIDGVKVLYVLTARDGLPEPVGFNSGPAGIDRLSVEYKSSGNEEFSVIRYSGEYLKNINEAFILLDRLILKNPGEKISQLEYEVICHGNFTPLVKYRGELLNPGRYSDGIIKYAVKDRFDEDENQTAETEILKFSTERELSEWYNSVLKYTEKNAGGIDQKINGIEKFENILMGVHHYIMTSVSKRGTIDFNPDEPALVLAERTGTVEERTLTAKTILEKRGIKAFISFRINKTGLIDKILLYVPEKRDRGYWLDFYGDGILEKMESGYEALVITGEGSETFPVNPETCIR